MNTYQHHRFPPDINTNKSLSMSIPISRGLVGVAFALLPLMTTAQQLEEVIVTAQKRTESLQDVAVSVQVVSGEELAALETRAYDGQAESVVARKRNEVSYRLSPWGLNLPSAMNLTRAQVQRVTEIFRRIICVS